MVGLQSVAYSNHVSTDHTRAAQSLLTSNALTLLACLSLPGPAAHCLFSASLAALRVLNWLKIMLRVQSVASSE